MKKSVIIIILVLFWIAVGIGAFFFFKKKKPTTTTAATSNNATTSTTTTTVAPTATNTTGLDEVKKVQNVLAETLFVKTGPTYASGQEMVMAFLKQFINSINDGKVYVKDIDSVTVALRKVLANVPNDSKIDSQDSGVDFIRNKMFDYAFITKYIGNESGSVLANMKDGYRGFVDQFLTTI